jgi:hypothetical protein
MSKVWTSLFNLFFLTSAVIPAKLFVRGVYILENNPTWGGGGEISQCHLGGKNMRRDREKGGNLKEKGRNGKEYEKKGSNKVR